VSKAKFTGKRPVVVDFETDGIEPRPDYPPKPVGVAIWEPGKKPYYLSWGHPTKNNCEVGKAKRVLSDIWKSGEDLLFQNAIFDLDVANVHLGLPLPPWHKVHDTLYTLFLKDPNASTFSLKPSAERYLGMKPEERDAIREWLIAHGIVAKNASDREVGKNISKAPGDIVGRYAIGDVIRTWKLHEKLYPDNVEAGMQRPYDRERQLMPILLENERCGMRFDVERAEKDLVAYKAASEKADAWLRKRLKAPGLNIDSDAELAEALDSAGIVTEWTYTPKSKKKSVGKKNLTHDKFKDQEVFKVLGYRNRLGTVMSLNLEPWAKMASAAGGYIFTHWNQVRGSGDKETGANTGRLTCSKFANVSKDFEDKNDGWSHPKKLSLPPLPLVRQYILPDKGDAWGHLDWSQQEFRLMGHYAEGEVLEAYQKDPRTDFHVLMHDRLVSEVGLDLKRRMVKITNFSIKYGAGAPRLADLLGLPVKDVIEVDPVTLKKTVTTGAATVIKGVKAATPSIAALDAQLKQRAKDGQPVRTWGGRLYYVEPPKYVEQFNRVMDFGYKQFSKLIQGSGADMMKEALIRYDQIKKDGRLLASVYDEANISAPPKAMKAECALLRQAMESMECDVPMLTDTDIGSSWGSLVPEKDWKP
jgi:DNA polymerase I-like protein with 3'-5' exonuclease and polymerase domains